MNNKSGRAAASNVSALGAIGYACLPAVLLLAACNQPPPPPAAAAPTTVIDRTKVIEVPVDADEQRRRDEERRREEEQRSERPH